MKTIDIGKTVSKRRNDLSIDQRDLSAIAGVAVHTLSNNEAGKGNPTVETLDRILDALGLELHIKVKA